MKRYGISAIIMLSLLGTILWSAQTTIDDVGSLTTPQAMMQAADSNFTELYGKWTALGATHDTSGELDALYHPYLGVGYDSSAKMNALWEAELDNSAGLLAALSDETGTGVAVFATSPTLVTPILGTPTSGALDNCTLNGADSVTALSVYTGTTSLDETTAANDSGASIIGVYDEFDNSDSNNLQDVVHDLDQAITGSEINWSDIAESEGDNEIAFNEHNNELVLSASGQIQIGDGSDNYVRFLNNAGTIELSLVGNATLSTGTQTISDTGIAIQTGTSDADFFEFAAYDVDGTAYEGLLRLVAGNTIYGYLGDNQTNAWRWDEDGSLEAQGTADIDLPAGSVDKADLATDAKFYSFAVATLSDSTTPSVLTTAETTNTCVSNYKGSGADHVFTMPAAHAAGNIIFSIGDEFQVDIEPDTGDLFYLNGSEMAANEHIQNTADTLGERIVGYCVNINATLRWMFYSSDGAWVEETP